MRLLTLFVRPALSMALLGTLLTPVSPAQIYESDLPATPKPAETAPTTDTIPDHTTGTLSPDTNASTATPPTAAPVSSPSVNQTITTQTAPATVEPDTPAKPSNNVFEDMFYSVNKPKPQPAATDITHTQNTDNKATNKSASIKKQSWRAMNTGDHREEAIQLELQRLKQEREYDQQQISKNSKALKQATDELDALQAQQQAILHQLTILAGENPTSTRKEK